MVTDVKKYIIPAAVTIMAAGTYINLKLAVKKIPNPYANYLDSQSVAQQKYRDSLKLSIKEQAERIDKIYIRDSVTTYRNFNLNKRNKVLRHINKKYKDEIDNINHYNSNELQGAFAELAK